MSKYRPSKIENKWQKYWESKKLYEPNLKNPKKRGKFYNLMMFPYPSAEGLHVGNMYAFVGADIYGRFKRMQGYDVFEPIGLDGFGIHSENFAFKTGKHPIDHAKASEKNFYRQLRAIGNSFAWDERLETYDPDYYKWTQWIFVQMFKNGLAYRKKATVNWCSSCLTVLADEQVLSGECERCATEVIKKELEQWFFGITKYAERLLSNISKIDWSERVKTAQTNWIGKSEGAIINFEISKFRNVEIPVFTTRPDTIYGATYIVLAPEHSQITNHKSQITNWEEVEEYLENTKVKSEVDRVAEGKEKTGVELKGIKAVNPATKEEIPIWIADYVLDDYGTGAIMAVPAHDERDAEFAKKFNLPFSDAPLVDKKEIIKKVSGEKRIQYHLRDWLISRQRYWGPPIPMVYCEKCGWQPVPEDELPVLLPKVKNFRPTGTDKSPLASVEKFYKTKCPVCKGEARRETDVSDTFLDSAWYYLRYPSVSDKKNPWNSEFTKKWLPVDMYIGGAEHSVLHLLYARFLAMVFKDLGLTEFEEPFSKFRAHGLLIKDGAKMSKSRGNIVSPDEYIKKYGADALRMYLMFLGPFEYGGDFRDTGISGVTRFLNKVWNFINKLEEPEKTDEQAEKILNKYVKEIGDDIKNMKFNTGVSGLMKLLNKLEDKWLTKKQYGTFLKLLAPFAPHIAEELWSRLTSRQGGTSQSRILDLLSKSGQVPKNYKSIHLQPWPEYDETLLAEETVTLVLQINGKVRDSVKVKRGMTEEEAKNVALSNNNVKKHLTGKEPKKYIYVLDRLLNIVV